MFFRRGKKNPKSGSNPRTRLWCMSTKLLNKSQSLPISWCHCSFLVLPETQGEADHRASDFCRSVHPGGLPGLPRRARTGLPEHGGVVIFGVALLCGHHSHHRRLRGLCTRYWHVMCSSKTTINNTHTPPAQWVKLWSVFPAAGRLRVRSPAGSSHCSVFRVGPPSHSCQWDFFDT